MKGMLLASAATLLLCIASVALAQTPGAPGISQSVLPSKAAAPARTDATESTEQGRARIAKLLAEAQAEGERAAEPPPGIDPREFSDLRDAQSRLVAAYDIQLRALDEIERARTARNDAEARARAWRGFDSPPPYSILLVDDLRDAQAATRDRIAVLEADLAQIKINAQRAQEDLKRAEEATRRAQDALAAAASPEDKARAAWRLSLAQLQARADAAAIAAVELHGRFRNEDLAARRAAETLLARQVGIASANQTFTEADLALARQRIDERMAEVRRDLLAVEGERSARLHERDLAQQAVERLHNDPSADANESAAAAARLAAAEAWVGVDRDRIDALHGAQLVGDTMTALWQERYTSVTGTDAEARRLAIVKMREAGQRAQNYKEFVDSLVREARARLSEVETQIAKPDLAPEVLRHEQDALAARRAGLLSVERLQEALGTVVAQVDRWLADADKASGQRDVRARMVDAWLALRDGVKRVWNFELFDVEDTTIVDGQPVTIQRGVTVGKSVGAVLLFLLSYLAIAAVARRVERRLVARGLDAPRVRTMRRWVLVLAAVLVALLTLNLAHIPFTVFAFLGGALAIGVGFGTQTIIKNFISGMLVLMERQVQVGDIVEVDNVTGTVTEVNIRSSTVRGFDGLETIVPNSTLIENKVTNWTHSDRKVRRVLKVGVAYGSPVREVADILRDCARRHGLVLDYPEPLVIFEDFGDSALVFALYIWVELAPTVNSLQVMSDLRFMIERRFAEADIVIPFPQRDIRLDATRPLHVEVVPPAAPAVGAPRQAAE